MGRLVYGVGVNDAAYMVSGEVEGRVSWCPYYERWKNMLQRAYCPKGHKRKPTYKNVTVCKEWCTFSVFKEWMEQQDWEGKVLDKDLLMPGNKVYGPTVCHFVSVDLNNLLLTSGARRGAHPLGVSLHAATGKYQAHCNVAGKSTYLGLFRTPLEAASVYKAFKAGLIREAAEKQEDYRLRESLLKHVNHLLEGV